MWVTCRERCEEEGVGGEGEGEGEPRSYYGHTKVTHPCTGVNYLVVIYGTYDCNQSLQSTFLASQEWEENGVGEISRILLFPIHQPTFQIKFSSWSKNNGTLIAVYVRGADRAMQKARPSVGRHNKSFKYRFDIIFGSFAQTSSLPHFTSRHASAALVGPYRPPNVIKNAHIHTHTHTQRDAPGGHRKR